MLITTKQKKVSQQTLTVVRIKLTYFVSKENVTVTFNAALESVLSKL